MLIKTSQPVSMATVDGGDRCGVAG
jgi:hypothetical protein